MRTFLANWLLITICVGSLAAEHFSLLHHHVLYGSVVKPLTELPGSFPAPPAPDVVSTLVLPAGRTVPPPGTPCDFPWVPPATFPYLAAPVPIEPANCFESVNFLLTGNPNSFTYRNWPIRVLQNPESRADWLSFQNAMRPGDVIEFVVTTRDRQGRQTSSNLHAQLCAGPGGLTVGANNEPRFTLVNGVPTFTHTWGICTSRQYYLALRSVNPAWKALGYDRTYTIIRYVNPDSH
jgi:hypothetical protein